MFRVIIVILTAALILSSTAAAARRPSESSGPRSFGSFEHSGTVSAGARTPSWNSPGTAMPPTGWGRRSGRSHFTPLSVKPASGPTTTSS
jgi:hypothetical protein